MALDEQAVERLRQMARDVGAQVGLDLDFTVASNPEFVTLTVGGVVILGPERVDAMAAHDIELELDAIRTGRATVTLDGDGVLRLVRDVDLSD